jgi:predicted TIM-barrel fold metal-dependent hydrolase
MEALFNAVDTTPIIDHHAHNLLLPQELETRQLLSITTEASDGALQHTPSSISHIRAVKQLSGILGCKEAWDDVQAAIDEKRKEPNDAWARSCFEGIETVLIDDGLDKSTVHPWDWHHRLTRSKCKRIVRIETLAESLLPTQVVEAVDGTTVDDPIDYPGMFEAWKDAFVAAITDAIRNPDVVGFKSVICYRTGLAIPEMERRPSHLITAFKGLDFLDFNRLEDEILSPYFVHLTAELIGHSSQPRKPFQFHTGLGDNDITLSLASPSHMQPFIKAHCDVPIVLLHASYPFTKEAGYLASVYENVFLDIGEVFPMISQGGQENVIRESLELCPSQKLLWSTDGHWFPETYVLAVIQVREAMKQVRYEVTLALTKVSRLSCHRYWVKWFPKTAWISRKLQELFRTFSSTLRTISTILDSLSNRWGRSMSS